MAEHEKTKPLLPTRPRGGHPGVMRAATLAAAVVTAIALLTSCNPYPQGPAGTVADKANRYSSATKTRHYFLTTTREFEVYIGVYDSCVRGASYPKCAG